MSFVNPFFLFASLGISLPILAHLLNRYQVQQTDWAAMQFLDRSIRVRSRQIKLQDLLLLILRCLALLALVFAVSRPFTRGNGGALAGLGEKRAGVIIALDVSFSMQHRSLAGGTYGQPRFAKAVELAETIAQTIRPGDPVSLILLGGEHRTVVRNMAFDLDQFLQILEEQKPTPSALDMDSIPRRLKELVVDMDAPQKEVYFITDVQENDWKQRSDWFRAAFEDLAKSASVTVVPVEGGSENLAITGLELVSGVLRKGTMARYRVTVRNCGTQVRKNVRVHGLVDNVTADTKLIPSIAPGTAESVSIFISFRDPGPVRISAKLDEDGLVEDNARRAVAVIRDNVSVLCVVGSPEDNDGSGRLIQNALLARGGRTDIEDIKVESVDWVNLPSKNLNAFDVVVLADVPSITEEQAKAFDRYVREGHGLVWFGGDQVKIDVWNQRSKQAGSQLLPAELEMVASTSDRSGVGSSLNPAMADHPICRPLFSLPKDLLSEARFRKLLKVKPSAASMRVLTLAGSDAPVLLEHALGRGSVFMFTTSAGPAWNNMAVTPVFLMLMQQVITYLTAREFEMPRMVGDALSLSYVDEPDTNDAVFDSPAGEAVSVPVRKYRNHYVAFLGDADEAGFYQARANLQSARMPIAVNVDTHESLVQPISQEDMAKFLSVEGVNLIRSEEELLDRIDENRTSRSLGHILLMICLGFLIMEALLAELLTARKLNAPQAANEGSE